MATRICIDVDLTLVNENEEMLPGVLEGLKVLKGKGYLLTLWSYGGADRARAMAQKHNLCSFFDGYATKPDLVIDDDAEEISRLPVIDAIGTTNAPRNWSKLSQFTVQLAEDLDNRSSWEQVPPWIKDMVTKKPNIGEQCAMAIWNQRDTYIRWPRHKRLLLKGVVRHPDGNNPHCYDYPPDLEAEIRQAGLPIDRRSNGPAILAFQLAGGDRPRRPHPSTWAWTVHHIYDGEHPHRDNPRVPHAINDGSLFTEAAGLVAVHPLADYVGMNVPLLAWLLRWEAFRRFEFDPMKVFH
jgi:hypothetical protein